MHPNGTKKSEKSIALGNAEVKYQKKGKNPYSDERLRTTLNRITSPSGQSHLFQKKESIGTVIASVSMRETKPITDALMRLLNGFDEVTRNSINMGPKRRISSKRNKNVAIVIVEIEQQELIFPSIHISYTNKTKIVAKVFGKALDE